MTAASFTADQIVVVALAIFFSAMITAVAGFGFGLMSVPLTSLVLDIHSAVIVTSIVAVFANAVQVRLYRRDRDRPLANRLALASIAGLPVGYAIFEFVGDTALRMALGVGVVLAVALLSRGMSLAHLGPALDWWMGFASGVLNTSISTSGPPLVFDLQARKLAPDAFRSTINYVFLVSGSIGLLMYTIGGKIHTAELQAGAIAIPALALGLTAGMPLRRRFSPEQFRSLVIVLLIAGAIAAVGKAFV